MAELLNRFFSLVFMREDSNNIPEPNEKVEKAGLSQVKIAKAKVKSKIKKLRAGAAAGPDGIGPQLLKALVEQVAGPLAVIMTKSLEEGSVPTDWLEANVTPIFKKGSRTEPGNYRPVSLTSVCCRMMEAILKDDIVTHLEKRA